MSVASVANLPAIGNFTILVDSEFFLVSAIAGSGPYTLTVAGAQEGSSAANHSSGASVYCILSAGGLAQILADMNQVGPYASRPTSTSGARLGMRYRCTDSPYEYIFDGSAWQAFVFGYNVTEPVLANFTQVNVDHTTFDSTHGGIAMYVPNQGASEHDQVLAQAIPASGAYYVDAACVSLVFNVNGGVGCGLSEGTSPGNKIAAGAFAFESGNSFYWERQELNSCTSWNNNAGGVYPLIFNAPLLWMRVYDDRTTNRTFYVSPNGYNWVQMLQESRTHFSGSSMTPAQGILRISPYQCTVQAHWVHFSIHA